VPPNEGCRLRSRIGAPPVASWLTPNVGDLPPSLHGHYPASSLLRSSPPLPAASVLSASQFRCLYLFPWHRRTGSQVPYESPNESHASYTPDTAWRAIAHPDEGRPLSRCGRPHSTSIRMSFREGPRVCRLSAGAKEIRTCMGFFLSSGCFRFIASSLFGAGKPFFVPSPAVRFPERAEGVKGPKR